MSELPAYKSATEHLEDELALVTMFISRAIARGRAEGWLEPGQHSVEVSEAELVDKFRTIERRLTKTQPAVPMDQLRQRLGLTLSEQRVIWTLIAYDLDPRLRRLLDHLSTHERGGVTLGTLLALLYHDAPGPGYVELAPGGHLDALRLIDIEPAAVSASQRSVRAVDRLVELASGIVRLDREVARYARLDERPSEHRLAMEHALDDTVTALVARAANGGASPLIALTGATGAGRRTLAGNAIARAGLSRLSVACDSLPTDAMALDRALRSIFREARLFGAALVFENLDQLVQDKGAARALDHAGLSSASVPAIAIVSAECSIPTSRPVHSIVIPPLRETDRIELWRAGISSPAADELSAEFASRYHVTGGVIVAAARRATQQAEAEQRTVTAEDVHHAIRGHVDSLLGGLGTRVFTTQSWDDVILPDDTLAEIKEMVGRVKHRRQVFESWGFAKKLQRGLGLSALFHGPPGTGKTMVAGLIARELGLDLYQVDLSRVVSKWVGETEKQLASLFAAAESGHAVLLFDEADSLFAKRTDVKSSNDRYANLEVNYLLQRMESFAGITILTTNHDSAIDEAFRRRLSFRVEFPKPEPEERERIWRAIVPSAAQLAPDVDFGELADRYEMTGGYIRNAALRAAFFAAAEGSAIRREHLQRAATLEMASMGKVVHGRAH